MTEWFVRDFTGRSLSALEQSLVRELGKMLDEIRPAQVDAAETAMTAEGDDALICLVPHRWLGGLCLVAWLRGSEVAVFWAQIGDLSCCHDDLDLGYEVARARVGSDPSPFAAAVLAMREQLGRSILLKTDSTRTWAEMALPDEGGRMRRVARIGKRPALLDRVLWSTGIEEFTVTFTDTQDPPVRIESGAARWFGVD